MTIEAPPETVNQLRSIYEMLTQMDLQLDAIVAELRAIRTSLGDYAEGLLAASLGAEGAGEVTSTTGIWDGTERRKGADRRKGFERRRSAVHEFEIPPAWEHLSKEARENIVQALGSSLDQPLSYRKLWNRLSEETKREIRQKSAAHASEQKKRGKARTT